MVDTVKMYSQDFELRERNRFLTDSVVDSEGKIVRERKYCNLPHLSLDLTGDHHLFLQTSLPKLLYKTSLYEVRPDDLSRTVETLEKMLSEAGIELKKNSLADFSLSRVDFCRNLQVELHPSNYLLTLGDFYMSRRHKQKYDHETLSYRNGEHELTFYNKVREIRETEKDPEVQRLIAERPENILRVESRTKNHKAILRVLKSKGTLAQVFDFEVCRTRLLGEMDHLVLNQNVQMELFFEENFGLLDRITQEQKRGAFRKFLAVKGVETFLREFRGDWEKIREFLSRRYRKSQVYFLLSELRELQSLALKPEKRDLIAEIREKISLVA